MQKSRDKKSREAQLSPRAPDFTRPAWGDQQMSCAECNDNEQDIDTFPCAKCHTRH